MTTISRRGWDRPGYGARPTTFTAAELRGETATRRIVAGPSAWIGLALMVANTAIALVDLSLLAGSIPR
jgi:hypothetical protein